MFNGNDLNIMPIQREFCLALMTAFDTILFSDFFYISLILSLFDFQE